MTEIVNRIINYSAEVLKCFLCDRQFSNSDVHWPMFKKRLGKNGETDCPLSVILSSALGKVLIPEAVHSKALCDECNFILLEFDNIQKRLHEFRLEILADYNNTAKANGLEPIWFHVKDLEDRSGINLKNNAAVDEKVVKTECEEEEIIVDHVPNNQGVPNYVVSIHQKFNKDEDTEMKNNVQMADNRAYAEQNIPDSTKQKRSRTDIDFHFTGNMYICPLCPEKPGFEPTMFSNHLKSQHNYNYHVCYICCKGFAKRDDMEYHMDKVHFSGIKGEFQCKTCQQVFLNQHLFRIHKRLHYDSMKKYECCACNKKYLSQKLLDEHMNMHIGNRPYKCMSCSKDFASKYTLKAHIQTHTMKRKQFKCDLCDKSYLNKRNLMNHTKLH